jgi:DNA topoisomerase-1
MADNLVIVESPAKAKTIGRYLGKNYKIVASVGHIRDLPKSQMGVDIEKDFEPKYITIRGKGDVISKLKKDVKTSKKVYLATDPDREGEAISWHLATILNINCDEKCRVSFNEITKTAVTSAIKSPRALDMDLVDAQQARRILDRLVGYKISPLLWRKVRKGLSAGRVQSVSTRLICDRESEIEAFKPEEYWSVCVRLSKLKHKGVFTAKYYGNGKRRRELKSGAETDALLKKLDGAEYRVAGVKQSEKRKNPAAPFITSTLQQEASRKLNFPSRKTMGVVQQLYEGVNIAGHGSTSLVTYIRTDSTRVSGEAQAEAAQYISGKYGQAYLPKSARVYKNRNAAQDAHEAIRPSHFDIEPEKARASLANDQYRLYKLIWDRFIASQMASAVYDQMSVDIEAAPAGSGAAGAGAGTAGAPGAGAEMFRAVGTKVLFKGYTAVYEESADDAGGAAAGDDPDADMGAKLPELAQGEPLEYNGIQPEQHFTQAPPRYTEATLIKALEEKGIGRPSTYSPTITTILARGYVEKEKKALFPTELGRAVNSIMTSHFKDIVDVAFTADMEKKLDDIEEGQKRWKTVLKEFYGDFEQVLKTAEDEIGNVEIPDEVSDVICEKCGRNMVVKMGRYGKFLACPGYPACRNAKPIIEYAGVQCPKCGGNVVYRKTKKGKKYIACENYANCDYRSWDMPTSETCPICGKFMTRSSWGGKNAKLKCSDENCPNGASAPRGGQAGATGADAGAAGESGGSTAAAAGGAGARSSSGAAAKGQAAKAGAKAAAGAGKTGAKSAAGAAKKAGAKAPAKAKAAAGAKSQAKAGAKAAAGAKSAGAAAAKAKAPAKAKATAGAKGAAGADAKAPAKAKAPARGKVAALTDGDGGSDSGAGRPEAPQAGAERADS